MRSNHPSNSHLNNTTRNNTRGGEASPVYSILKSLLDKHGLGDKLQKYTFIQKWQEIVGAKLALVSKPICFKGSILLIEVKSSSWAQELSFHQELILGRVNNFFKELFLKEVNEKRTLEASGVTHFTVESLHFEIEGRNELWKPTISKTVDSHTNPSHNNRGVIVKKKSSIKPFGGRFRKF